MGGFTVAAGRRAGSSVESGRTGGTSLRGSYVRSLFLADAGTQTCGSPDLADPSETRVRDKVGDDAVQDRPAGA